LIAVRWECRARVHVTIDFARIVFQTTVQHDDSIQTLRVCASEVNVYRGEWPGQAVKTERREAALWKKIGELDVR
jgi:hypothetical protein